MCWFVRDKISAFILYFFIHFIILILGIELLNYCVLQIDGTCHYAHERFAVVYDEIVDYGAVLVFKQIN